MHTTLLKSSNDSWLYMSKMRFRNPRESKSWEAEKTEQTAPAAGETEV